MEIVIAGDADDAARIVADMIVRVLRSRAAPVVGLATGGSPLATYRRLVERHPVARAVEGPVTAMCPASVLQLHPHATVVVDEAAAAGLQLAEYYRSVYAGKPAWQHL